MQDQRYQGHQPLGHQEPFPSLMTKFLNVFYDRNQPFSREDLFDIIIKLCNFLKKKFQVLLGKRYVLPPPNR